MSNKKLLILIEQEIKSLGLSEINAVGAVPTPTASPKGTIVPKQPVQPSDVQSLNRANQNANSVQKASGRINTTLEFPEAFRLWFQSLGYKPDNQSISIMKVRMEIERVMRELGFK
jgi:hypothetical protein